MSDFPNEMVYLECVDGYSNKWYSVTRIGQTVRLQYGPIGRTQSDSVKTFDSEAEARKFADKQVASKLKKGYVRA